jgi:hypothetical protein
MLATCPRNGQTIILTVQSSNLVTPAPAELRVLYKLLIQLSILIFPVLPLFGFADPCSLRPLLCISLPPSQGGILPARLEEAASLLSGLLCFTIPPTIPKFPCGNGANTGIKASYKH